MFRILHVTGHEVAEGLSKLLFGFGASCRDRIYGMQLSQCFPVAGAMWWAERTRAMDAGCKRKRQQDDRALARPVRGSQSAIHTIKHKLGCCTPIIQHCHLQASIWAAPAGTSRASTPDVFQMSVPTFSDTQRSSTPPKSTRASIGPIALRLTSDGPPRWQRISASQLNCRK